MKKLLLAVIALIFLFGCKKKDEPYVDPDDIQIVHTLVLRNNFPGYIAYGNIAGVTYDNQHLWLAYRYDLGGYYDNDKVVLAEYDSNFSVIDTFSFCDRYEPIGGLTSDGQHLWLQYSASSTGSNFIREIDPVNKTIINTFTTEYGVWGVSFYNNLLYLNYYFGKVQRIDPSSGELVSSNDIPMTENSMGNCYGIAVKLHEIWISNRLLNANNELIYVLNDDFTMYGAVKNSLDFAQICFMNSQLVIATLTRVYIYDIY